MYSEFKEPLLSGSEKYRYTIVNKTLSENLRMRSIEHYFGSKINNADV